MRSFPGQRESRQSRWDIHDATAVVHQRKQLLCQEVHAFEVDIDYIIELSLGHFFEDSGQRIACIIDKIVKAIPAPELEGLTNIGYEFIEWTRVAGVMLKSRSLAPQRFDVGDESVGLCLVRMVSKDDVDATLGEINRGVAADTTARSVMIVILSVVAPDVLLAIKLLLCFHGTPAVQQKVAGRLNHFATFVSMPVRPARTGALHHSTRRHPLRRRALRFGLVRDYALRR
jgi:hypothetical protein